MKLLAKIIAAFLAFPLGIASAEKISGVVDRINEQNIFFRAAEEDLQINLNKLSDSTQAKLKDPQAKIKIFTINIPTSAIKQRMPVPRKVRNNCSELPLSFKELQEIANQPNIHNIIDFLAALPKGTMQSFTLTAASQSEQRAGINPLWPSVLRGNIDGKLSISYTCNPESNTYNKVNIMYFERGGFKTAQFDFNKELNPELNRSELNPQSCLYCHATSRNNMAASIRPNWSEYPFWSDCIPSRGSAFYGASDDSMNKNQYRARQPSSPQQVPKGCTAAKDIAAHELMVDNFKTFKEQQKNNPCYQLLPWGEGDSNYPYTTNRNIGSDLASRANLKFTNVYSYLNSQRIHSLLKKNPNYEKMKYFLALEAASCLNAKDESDLKSQFPDMKLVREDQVSKYDPRQFALLYQFSVDSGSKAADWSLEYNSVENPIISPAYNTGITRGLSSGEDYIYQNMGELVQGEILKELIAENYELAKVNQNLFYKGITEDFGEAYSCFDSFGGGLRDQAKGEAKALCAVLHRENIKHLQLAPNIEYDRAVDIAISYNPEGEILSAILSQKPENFNQSAERGRKLVQIGEKRCVRCHSPGGEKAFPVSDSLLFVPQENLPLEEQRKAIAAFKKSIYNDDLLNLVKKVIANGQMPLNAPALNPSEQEDVLNYFRKISIENK